MLKRHLMTDHKLTPQQYREKWGLPRDYPMVAPNYAQTRSALAKKIGLGRKSWPAGEARRGPPQARPEDRRGWSRRDDSVSRRPSRSTERSVSESLFVRRDLADKCQQGRDRGAVTLRSGDIGTAAGCAGSRLRVFAGKRITAAGRPAVHRAALSHTGTKSTGRARCPITADPARGGTTCATHRNEANGRL